MVYNNDELLMTYDDDLKWCYDY